MQTRRDSTGSVLPLVCWGGGGGPHTATRVEGVGRVNGGGGAPPKIPV
jgi:hypothetical protein